MNREEIKELAKLAGVDPGTPHSRAENSEIAYFKPKKTKDGFIDGDNYLRGLAFERNSLKPGQKFTTNIISSKS